MGKIQAQVILEILGRPAENVKKALKDLIKRLDNEQGINIISQKIHKPKSVKKSKELFTAFADVTLDLDSLDNYFGLLFAYMPSHIELIEPERIELSNFELSDLASKLIQRLHSYDAVTKRMIVERDLALRKLKEISPELFKLKDIPLETELKPKKQSRKKSSKKKTKKSKNK